MEKLYTLKLALDSSSLRGINLGGSGGKDKKESSAIERLFGGKSNLKMIGKLGTIAFGIGGIFALVKKMTALVVDSSPMFKAMLQLLNTSLMFVFRPIGDFFGFFLKPILLYFMMNFAIPFYKNTAPVMQALGNALGNGILDFATDPKAWFERNQVENNVKSEEEIKQTLTGESKTGVRDVWKLFQDLMNLPNNFFQPVYAEEEEKPITKEKDNIKTNAELFDMGYKMSKETQQYRQKLLGESAGGIVPLTKSPDQMFFEFLQKNIAEPVKDILTKSVESGNNYSNSHTKQRGQNVQELLQQNVVTQ